MQTRCKFRCNRVAKRNASVWDAEAKSYRQEEVHDADLYAVCGGRENEAFFKSTPAGTLQVTTIAPGVFEPGKEYFLDISEAD